VEMFTAEVRKEQQAQQDHKEAQVRKDFKV
jgi:hypothetical protein